MGRTSHAGKLKKTGYHVAMPKDLQVSYGAGVEVLLLRAVKEPDFRAAFLRDPVSAAASGGVSLSPSEKALLGSLDQTTLGAMVETLVRQGPGDHGFKGTYPEDVDLIPAPPTSDMEDFDIEAFRPVPAGIRPETQDPVRGSPPMPIGPSQGIRPDRPVVPELVKGIRPGRVILATAAAATVLGTGLFLAAAGISPRRPAPADGASGVRKAPGDKIAPARTAASRTDGGLDAGPSSQPENGSSSPGSRARPSDSPLDQDPSDER